MNDEETMLQEELEEEPGADVGPEEEEPEPDLPPGYTEDNPIMLHNWEEFIDKCSHAYTQEGAEKPYLAFFKFVDADPEDRIIDLEKIYPDGLPNSIVLYYARIDFNGWEVRNLTVNSDKSFGDLYDSSVFKIHQYTNDSNEFKHYITNLTLSNLLLKTRPGTYSRILINTYSSLLQYQHSDGGCVLTNCSISGVLESNTGLTNSNAEFHFCSFNLAMYGERPIGGSHFYQCNMKSDIHALTPYKRRHNVTCPEDSTSRNFYGFDIHGHISYYIDCYVEYDINIDYDATNEKNTSPTLETVYYLSPCHMQHCVLNIRNDELYITTTTHYNTNRTYSVFNSDRLPQGIIPYVIDDNDISKGDIAKIFLNGLTEEEMKNPIAVANAGIPIGSDKR